LKAEPLYKTIERITQDGTLAQLVKAGLLAPKSVLYYQIFLRVQYLNLRLTRTPRKNILLMVAEEYKVSVATIYRAEKLMLKKVA
jgi:hypothetical protein